MVPLLLDGCALRIAEVVEVARQGRPVGLAPSAEARMAASHQLVQRVVDGEDAVYGINTGFGHLSRVRIPAGQLAELQHNLLRSHACGVGEPLTASLARTMMLLSAASLARGHSGVRPAVGARLCELLNAGIHPCIPGRGSVGASGDLAPLAHMALVLIGEGEVLDLDPGGARPAAAALAAAGLTPLTLGPKEGLALINGTHFMAGHGALLLHDADLLFQAAELAVAMSLEAIRGTAAPLDARIHALRPQAGQALVAARLRDLAAGSGILISHADCGRVQDQYSLRCAPQVLGAIHDGMTYVRNVVERELGAVTDNPLCFPNDGVILSGGNFHGQPLALALDLLGIALAQLAAFSERRTYLLVGSTDPATRLPPALTKEAGTRSGVMIAQYTAAALANECQGLATPASLRSLPTGAGMEDYNSMGATSAHNAARILDLARKAVAIELLCAAQGLEFQRPLRAGAKVEEAHARIRAQVAPLDQDRVLTGDIATIEQLIAEGALAGEA
jgi:histidine ammonia-lyase